MPGENSTDEIIVSLTFANRPCSFLHSTLFSFFLASKAQNLMTLSSSFEQESNFREPCNITVYNPDIYLRLPGFAGM